MVNIASNAVLGNLRVLKNMDKRQYTFIEFEPSIGLVAGRIDKLGLDIRSFREPLKRAIKDVMIPSISKNFDVGGRPAWAPLSDFTLLNRQVAGTGTKILDATGKLKRVATQQNIWDISLVAAVIRDIPEKAWYGKVHQGGLNKDISIKLAGKKQTIKTQAQGGIPARPFFVIQDEDEDEIELVFITWLQERIDRQWVVGKLAGMRI